MQEAPPLEKPALSYRRPRHPGEGIAPCVCLYYRFPLPYRGAAERRFERGVIVSSERIRPWCPKVGPVIETEPGRRRPPLKGSERCDGSRLRRKRSGFWSHAVPSGNTAVRAGSAAREATTGPS